MLRSTHEQSLHALLDDLSPDAKQFEEEEVSLHFSASVERRARSTTYHLDETPPRVALASPPALRAPVPAAAAAPPIVPPVAVQLKVAPEAVAKPRVVDRTALRDAVNALDKQSHTSRSSSANSAVFKRLTSSTRQAVATPRPVSLIAPAQPRRAAPAPKVIAAKDASPAFDLATIAPDFDVALSPLSTASPQRTAGRSVSQQGAHNPLTGPSGARSETSEQRQHYSQHPPPHTVGPRARRELMALYEHLNSVIRYSAMATVLRMCGLPNDQASCDDVWFELVGGMSVPYVTADRFIVVLARRGAEVDMEHIHHHHHGQRHEHPRGALGAVMSPAAADASSDDDSPSHRRSSGPVPFASDKPQAEVETRTSSPNPAYVPPAPLQPARAERQASLRAQSSQGRAASVRSTNSSTLSRRPTAALSPSGAPVVSFDAYDRRAHDNARHGVTLAVTAVRQWNGDTGVQRRSASVKERLQTRQQQHAQALAAAVASSQPRTEAGGRVVFDTSTRIARRVAAGIASPVPEPAVEATFRPQISEASRRLAELRRTKNGQRDFSMLATESSARKVHSNSNHAPDHSVATSPLRRVSRPERVPKNSYAARLEFKQRHTDPTQTAPLSGADGTSPRSPPRLADLHAAAVHRPVVGQSGELQRAADALRHFLVREETHDRRDAKRLRGSNGLRETFIGLPGEGRPKSMAPTPPPVREREATECTFTPITHRAPDSEASRIEAARFFHSLNGSSASNAALPPAPAAAARPTGYFEEVARLRRCAAIREVDPKRRSASSDAVYRNAEFFTTLRASPAEPYVPPHLQGPHRPDGTHDTEEYQQHAHSVNSSSVYDPQWTGANHPIVVPVARGKTHLQRDDGTTVTFQTPTEAAFSAAAAAPPSMAAAAAARGDGFTEAVAICAGEESAAALSRLRALLNDPGIDQVEGATYRSLANPLAMDALEASVVQFGASSNSSAGAHPARPLLRFPGAQAAAQGSVRALVVSPATGPDAAPLSAMTNSSAVLVLPPPSSVSARDPHDFFRSATRRGSEPQLDPHTLDHTRGMVSSLTAAAASLSSSAGASRPITGAAVEVSHYDPTAVGPRRFSVALCVAYGLDPARFAPAVERDLRVILRAAVVAETGGPAAVDVGSYEARWRRSRGSQVR